MFYSGFVARFMLVVIISRHSYANWHTVPLLNISSKNDGFIHGSKSSDFSYGVCERYMSMCYTHCPVTDSLMSEWRISCCKDS